MRNLKKKAALLLALVMMLAAVPMNVFGTGAGFSPAVTGTGVGQVIGINLLQNDLAGLHVDGNRHIVLSLQFHGHGNNRFQFGGENHPYGPAVQYWGQNVSVTSPAAHHVPGTLAGGQNARNAQVTLVLPSTWVNPDNTVMPGDGLLTVSIPNVRVYNTTARLEIIAQGRTVFNAYLLPGGLLAGADAGLTFLTTGTQQAIGEFGSLMLPNIVVRESAIGSITGDLTVAQPGTPRASYGQRIVNRTTANRNDAGAVVSRTMQFDLLAPWGWTWAANPTPGISSANGTFVGLSTSATRHPYHGAENRVLSIVVTLVGRSALTTVPGEFQFSGLQLDPVTNQAGTGNINIGVFMTTSVGGSRSGDGWNRNYAVTVGGREIGGLTGAAYGAVPTIRTGFRSGYNNFGGRTIQVIEQSPAIFTPHAPITITLDNPNVAINAVRWNVRNNAYGVVGPWAGQWNASATAGHAYGYTLNRRNAAGDLITSPNGHISGNTAMIRPPQSGNPNRLDRIDIQLDLYAVPGANVGEVNATVEVLGWQPLTFSVPVANFVDPLTLTAGAPIVFPESASILTVVGPANLPPVTLEETAAGVLQTGRFIYMAIVPTLGGNIVPGLLDMGGINFAGTGLTATRTSGNIQVGPVERVTSIPSGVSSALGNMALFRVRVFQQSTQPSAIQFTPGLMTGAVLAMPGIELQFVVFGNAVAYGIPGSNIANYGQTRLDVAPASYSAVVATFGGQLVPPPTTPPGNGQVPPTPTVPTVTVNRNALNSQGGRVIATVEGQTWVNLRGLVENLPGGTVAWTPETGATFSAPHATNGTISTIWEVSAGVFNAEVNNVVGTRGARFINHEYSWFVSIDAFQTLFGFLPVLVG